MIKKTTIFEFTCDVCKMSKESLYTDSAKKAKAEILKYGWKTQRKDKKLTFICPYCVRKSENSGKKQQNWQEKQFDYAPNWYDYYENDKNKLISKEMFEQYRKKYINYANLYYQQNSYFSPDWFNDYKAKP